MATSSSLVTSTTNTTTNNSSVGGGGGTASAYVFPPPPESPLYRYQQQNHDVDSDSSNPSLTPNRSSSGLLPPLSAGGPGSSSSPASGGSAAAPKSPVRTIVRAHLGDHGHTFVPTKPGINLRDALAKAMKLRRLAPETCAVYKLSDPTKTALSWDMDISQLNGEEIKVEMSDSFPVTTSISHNFVRKTFFSLAFCECCRRLLFTV